VRDFLRALFPVLADKTTNKHPADAERVASSDQGRAKSRKTVFADTSCASNWMLRLRSRGLQGLGAAEASSLRLHRLRDARRPDPACRQGVADHSARGAGFPMPKETSSVRLNHVTLDRLGMIARAAGALAGSAHGQRLREVAQRAGCGRTGEPANRQSQIWMPARCLWERRLAATEQCCGHRARCASPDPVGAALPPCSWPWY
jgi:hypothetical protein